MNEKPFDHLESLLFFVQITPDFSIILIRLRVEFVTQPVAGSTLIRLMNHHASSAGVDRRTDGQTDTVLAGS